MRVCWRYIQPEYKQSEPTENNKKYRIEQAKKKKKKPTHYTATHSRIYVQCAPHQKPIDLHSAALSLAYMYLSRALIYTIFTCFIWGIVVLQVRARAQEALDFVYTRECKRKSSQCSGGNHLLITRARDCLYFLCLVCVRAMRTRRLLYSVSFFCR